MNVALNGYVCLLAGFTAKILQQSDLHQTNKSDYYSSVSFATMIAALATIEKALLVTTPTLQIKSDGTLNDLSTRSDPSLTQFDLAHVCIKHVLQQPILHCQRTHWKQSNFYVLK